VKGIMRVMRKLDMLPALKNKAPAHSTTAYSSYWIRAEYSGTIVFDKKLGAKVSKGEVIATIANPLSSEEHKVLATKTGIVIGKSNLPLAHEGEALFHIACLEKPQQVADKISQLAEMTLLSA
jgi:predicted deacylase